MARAAKLSVTGAGSSSTFFPHPGNPFNIGFGCQITGTVSSYDVEHSFDGGTTWFNHETVVAQSTNQDGNYAFPVSAIRVTINSGTGTVDMYLIQAG